MRSEVAARLSEVLGLLPVQRAEALVELAEKLLSASESGAAMEPQTRARLAELLTEVLEEGVAEGALRLHLGEVLGKLGDPRLCSPADAAYWAPVSVEEGTSLQVGRFMVTNQEFRAWVDRGGYDDPASWSEAGLAWKEGGEPCWAELSAPESVAHLTVANQPVVGVSWYEAEAYANAHGARLLSMSERRVVSRGPDKRPYPWGSPFGCSNANTREEALGRPCAVGLFLSDRSPDGVWDLAGNVGEWLSDGAGDQRMLHPGSWARPSMAAWAKALDTTDAGSRSSDLGFRLCKD